MNSPLDSLDHLLQLLLTDLSNGTVKFTPCLGVPNNYEARKWRGLHNVVVRYDCVNFWINTERDVEARSSRLPTHLSDQVYRVWAYVGHGLEHADEAWKIVQPTFTTK